VGTAAEMAAAATEMAAATAEMTTMALSEARGRHRKKRQRCSDAQYFQTCHDQTPFPGANPIGMCWFLGSHRFAHEM
jgi:hypothetical protein